MIFGGHDHRAMMQSDFGATYLKSGADFQNIWYTKLHYTPPPNRYIYMQHTNIPITSNMPTDPEMDIVIEQYRSEAEKDFRKVIGSSSQDLDCTTTHVRTREVGLGNFIADAHRVAYDIPIDFGIINGGGLRADKIYPAGNITYGNVLEWIPFRNTVTVLRLSGKTMAKFMHANTLDSCGSSGLIRPSGYLAHPSGFKYRFRCTGAQKGILERLEDENGQPIEQNEWFTLALTDFWYDEFQDIFKAGKTEVLISGNDAVPIDVSVRDLILQQKVIHPTLQGRLVLLSSSSSTRRHAKVGDGM